MNEKLKTCSPRLQHKVIMPLSRLPKQLIRLHEYSHSIPSPYAQIANPVFMFHPNLNLNLDVSPKNGGSSFQNQFFTFFSTKRFVEKMPP